MKPRSFLSPLALVAALVLAGCATPTERVVGDTDGPATEEGKAPSFLAPVTLPGQRGGPEPVVALAPDGTLFVAAQDPVGGGPRVWTSRDSGKSWSERRPAPESGGEVDLAVGPNGLVVLTQLGTRGNVVTVSRDGGKEWSTAPFLAATQYFDRQWAAIDARGSAYLLAREFGDRTSAAVARSDDQGLTWLPQGRPWDAENEPGSANGNLVAAGNVLYLAYVCRDAKAVCVATSRDQAETWDRMAVVERPSSVDNVYPAIAASGNRVVVVWSDSSEGRLAVWATESRDSGGSWSEAVRVSGDGESATLPWVAVGRDRAWVVYLSSPADLRVADGRDAAAAAWTPVARRLGEGAAPAGEAAPLTPEPVHAGVLSRPVGRPEAGAPYDRNFGDFFTATLDKSGRLVVAVSRDRGTPDSTRDLVVREA